MDLEALWLLVGVGAGVFAVFQGVRGLLRRIAHRRAQRHLDEAGLTTTAQVIKVEPMQRELNGAAGQPMSFSFRDTAGQERYIRDTSGLGGYLVREGSRVVVRYSPDDIDLARVEQIVGPRGHYPVHPDGRTGDRSLLRSLLELVLGVAFAAAFGAVTLAYLNGAEDQIGRVMGRLMPLIFLLAGISMLVAAGKSIAERARQRRRPREHVGGMVTEVWSEQVGGGGRSQPRTVYPFTVHFVTGDGREVHTRSPGASGGFQPRRQQLVRVHHDREHPVRFEVGEVSGASTLGVVVLTLLGVVFTGVGAGLWLFLRDAFV